MQHLTRSISKEKTIFVRPKRLKNRLQDPSGRAEVETFLQRLRETHLISGIRGTQSHVRRRLCLTYLTFLSHLCFSSSWAKTRQDMTTSQTQQRLTHTHTSSSSISLHRGMEKSSHGWVFVSSAPFKCFLLPDNGIRLGDSVISAAVYRDSFEVQNRQKLDCISIRIG